MGYESYRVCDECGKREKVNHKHDVVSDWVDVDICAADYRPRDTEEMKGELSGVVCSMKCARAAVRKWLAGQG